jgi:hypothetical protein
MVEAGDTAGDIHNISYLPDHHNGHLPHLCERAESKQGMELDNHVGRNHVLRGSLV